MFGQSSANLMKKSTQPLKKISQHKSQRDILEDDSVKSNDDDAAKKSEKDPQQEKEIDCTLSEADKDSLMNE